jgi:CBS domain-containing protein
MNKELKAADIMTTKAVSVSPDMLITEANEIIYKNSFNGLPVVNGENMLLGIITEYDLIAKGSNIHLPTFQKIVSELKIDKQNKSLGNDLDELKKLKVSDVMNIEPLTLTSEAPFEDIVRAFQEHHRVNPIIVIDENKSVVGIISRSDLLRYMIQ